MGLVKCRFGTMSLTHNRKRKGPVVLPCRTPHFTSAFTKRTQDNSTKCFWPSKYYEQARGTHLTLNHSSLLQKMMWSTRSNALKRSQKDLLHRIFTLKMYENFSYKIFDCIGNRKIGSKTILIQQQDIRTIQARTSSLL